MLKQISKGVVCICLMAPGPRAGAQTYSDVRIISSTARECRVTYTPENIETAAVRTGAGQYRRIYFDRAVPWTIAGEPLVPARVMTFGVPENAEVDVRVTAAETQRLPGDAPLPTPQVISKDEITAELYPEGSVYRSGEAFPAAWYQVEGPFYSGQQRIVQVFVYPVRFLPGSRELVMCREFEISLNFSRPAAAGNGGSASFGLRQVKKGLINGEAVGRWQKPALRPAADKAAKRQEQGVRIKMSIREEGVYQVKGEDLAALGINLSLIDPATVKIGGNGGRMISHSLSEEHADTLQILPCLLEGGEDGVFNTTDRVVFYARGTEDLEWVDTESRFSHYRNLYTNENIYWFIFNDGRSGKRYEETVSTHESSAQEVTSFQDLVFLEQDINNPAEGGLTWLGRQFRRSTPVYTSAVNLPGYQPGTQIRFYVRLAGGTSGQHEFDLGWNQNAVSSFSLSSTQAAVRSADYGGAESSDNTLGLEYRYSGSSAEPFAYLDWYEIAYTRSIEQHDGKIRFFSPAAEGLYEYHIAGFSGEPLILRVTDPAAAERIIPHASGEGRLVTLEHDGGAPDRFIACDPDDLPVPGNLTIAESSGIKHSGNGCDMLIITHEDFFREAQRLAAHRQSHDSLSVQVIDVQDVYDEFSGGLFDPAAIRLGVKYAFENWSTAPSYLLLFGDGHYDYRNLISPPGGIWIPPFEYAGYSLSSSRVSDDWYTYVSGDDMVMDLAVGRIPVQSAGEAGNIVDKIIAYETAPEQGVWKNVVTVVADDEKAAGGQGNEINHIRASEYIAEFIIPDRFSVDKIYLTEYPAVITGDGLRKPDAKQHLLDRINQGSLIVNYIGHGNQKLWAHEWIFHRDIDLDAIANGARLPLVYAATCSFGWYDRIGEQSFSEALLSSGGRGAVNVIAAARLCSAPYNEALNTRFMDFLLGGTGKTLRLGDAMRLAKLNAGTRINNEYYHILGDPAMRLTSPKYEAVFTGMEPDSFQALGLVSLQGEIRKEGAFWDSYHGTVVLQAFDSRKQTTYTTEYGSKLNYVLAGNRLFKGEADVTGGRFDVSFIVPKDLSYGGSDGRLSTYFSNGTADGSGYKDGISVGGSSGLQDSRGPDMEIGFAGRDNFVSGDLIVPPLDLTIIIEDDKSGINLTGEIGHKIMLTVDGDSRHEVTDYFSYDKNSYLKGSLTYLLADLDEGIHEVSVKAWDNANNSSTSGLIFEVVQGDRLRIDRLMNFPNPFEQMTDFTFYLNLDAEITVKIFTVSGRLIRTISRFPAGAGFNMIAWDGTDELGDRVANGVYLYKVTGKASAGGETLSAEKIERLMIVR